MGMGVGCGGRAGSLASCGVRGTPDLPRNFHFFVGAVILAGSLSQTLLC